jgi:hypothetical protein
MHYGCPDKSVELCVFLPPHGGVIQWNVSVMDVGNNRRCLLGLMALFIFFFAMFILLYCIFSSGYSIVYFSALLLEVLGICIMYMYSGTPNVLHWLL